MVILVDQPFSTKDLASHLSLDLRNIKPDNWSHILDHCCAKELRLYHITLTSLEGIENLHSTRKLKLEWATKIESLAPVFKLRALTQLMIEDFARLRDLKGIEHLEALTELHLAGNLGSLTPPLRLQTLAPITRLPKLKTLDLRNVKLEDDDITCLTKCKNLRSLFLANRFDRRQFAFLAKRLNPQLDTPIKAYRGGYKCERCNAPEWMFLGRRMPSLCSKCDRDKAQKLIREFDQLMTNS